MLDQIDLLQAIAETGSITAAAKAAGISYKTAWDRLERINNLSQQPIIERNVGGTKGGGSSLTEYGNEILNGFKQLQEQHNQFLESLNQQLNSLDDVSKFVKNTLLQTSARNQFLGNIAAIEFGAVNSEVQVQISDSQRIVAMVTEQSRLEMKLAEGLPVIAMIKASSVTLAVGSNLQVSARNILTGTLLKLDRGAVNADVTIQLAGNKTLSAMITNQSAEQLTLMEGMTVSALFKASSVILMAA
ncbi:MAG: ModE family transcriptional regulator [Pseudohongiella sp.]|nr:MAG: ModE family transcriptional regulator [Pseudohongiella sp.]